MLSCLRARDEAVQNLTVRATWEELVDNRLTRWTEQTIYRDDLGRMRITSESGTYNAQGERIRPPDIPHQRDKIYDGEITVEKEHFPHRDRLGGPVGDPENAEGYRTAQLYDGVWPMPLGLQSTRNPFTFVDSKVMDGLQESLADERPVTIERLEEGKERYRVAYQRADAPQLRHAAVVDGDRGWIVTKIELTDENNQLVSTTDCEYRRDESGAWLPLAGSMKTWEGGRRNAQPSTQWRFTVRDLRLNDPAFDETVFDVLFEPDTAIWDARYRVNYRIGADQAFKDDLARLAQQAKEQTALGPLGQGGGEPLERRTAWLPMVLGGAVLIAILLALGARSRLRPPHGAGKE